MNILHTDDHLRLSINLEAPPGTRCYAALQLVQLEGQGQDQSEYSPVIGQEVRGSCKFRRRIPSSEVGSEGSEVSVGCESFEVKRRTRVRISCMQSSYCFTNAFTKSNNVCFVVSSSITSSAPTFHSFFLFPHECYNPRIEEEGFYLLLLIHMR